MKESCDGAGIGLHGHGKKRGGWRRLCAKLKGAKYGDIFTQRKYAQQNMAIAQMVLKAVIGLFVFFLKLCLANPVFVVSATFFSPFGLWRFKNSSLGDKKGPWGREKRG